MASTTRADRRRAQAIAAAALSQAAAAGIALPPHLRLWSLAGSPGAGPVAGTGEGGDGGGSGGGGGDPRVAGAAGGLAAVLEAVTPAEQRQANGLHVTPGWLADELVALTLDGLSLTSGETAVCDPACGGGAFLVSAATALHARGVPRREVVRDLLWGADVDPVGLAVAEVALALWAGEAPPPGRLVVGDPLLRGPALWPDRPAGGFGAVVGNPPFLSQLGRATVRPAETTERLRRRFGAAVRPYTDTAWLFLLLACELVRDRGRITLVQPLSLVAARDAAVVRQALDHRADLRHLWVERRRSFAASTKVCAPVLDVRPRRDRAAGGAPATVRAGTGSSAAARRLGSGERSWAGHLADAMGVPPVAGGGRERLGDRATVLAGFRDEYYGLVPLVREAGAGGAADGTGDERPLVTAGVIDWGRCAWGERPSRFAKQRWAAPVVDPSRLRPPAQGIEPARDGAQGTEPARDGAQGTEPARDGAQGTKPARDGAQAGELARDAARWVERTAGPKVVVATQTRVVEAAVDEGGSWVPSVPALAVLPHDPGDLWHLAAALSAPTATAWLLRRAPETGLSRGALRVAAPDLVDLPLPADGPAWDAAAAALRDYARAPTAARLDAFARAAAAAHGASPALVRWWRDRLPTVPSVAPGADR